MRAHTPTRINDAFCLCRESKYPAAGKSPFILEDISIPILVVEMEYLHMPEIVTFEGEEAKKILEEYIMELEQNKPDELTESQAKVMKRVARELISVIEGETQTPPLKRQNSFFPAVARTLKERLQQLVREEDQVSLTSQTGQSKDCHHQPLSLNQQFK
jgi:uncharacterized protein (DUF2344 family)